MAEINTLIFMIRFYSKRKWTKKYGNLCIKPLVGSIVIYIILLLIMGGSQPQKPKPTLEDALIEMKINSKRLNRESTKAMKESQTYMKKAKEALKKNNEDGAKLYLQSAASKRA